MLVSAAEVTYRYGRDAGTREKSAARIEKIVSLLHEALQLDAKNRRAELLLERVLREEGRYDELSKTLESFADLAPQKDERIAGWARLGRLLAKKMNSTERAAAAYERVIDLAPGHPEASSFLADYFTSHEMWDHLVALYEGQLATGVLRGKDELGRRRAGCDGALAHARQARGGRVVVRARAQARAGAPGDARLLSRVLFGARRGREVGDRTHRSAARHA